MTNNRILQTTKYIDIFDINIFSRNDDFITEVIITWSVLVLDIINGHRVLVAFREPHVLLGMLLVSRSAMHHIS